MQKLIIENAFTDELLYRINTAQKKIYAFIYYAKIHQSHRNDHAKKVLDALVAARIRNLDVKILLNNQIDQGKPARANKKFAGQLAIAGVDARLSKKGRMTHAKTWIFDDSGVIVGSHNITLRSMRISREVSIYVEDSKINQQLTNYFLEQFCHTGE